MCGIPVVLAAAGVYFNSLDGQFVHDDLSAITGNHDVTGSGSAGSGRAGSAGSGTAWDFLHNDFWGTALLDPKSHKSYRPLTILTFKWNFMASGLNPWSYHVVNVTLHATVSALLAWTCHRCLRLSTATSTLTAFLFAIHPIHTEAVSGIVGRADILTTLLFLVSFISHNRAASVASLPSVDWRRWKVVSVVSALLALAAKENGIAVLPIAITWDIIRLHCSRNAKLTRANGIRWMLRGPIWKSGIVASIAATVALLSARILLQRGQLPLFSEQDNPAAFASNRKSRILTLLYLPVFNMGLLVAPVLLSYDWQNGSIPLVEDFSDVRNAASLLFYTVMAGAWLHAWTTRKRSILFSLIVMVMPMLPASNLFYPVGFVVAERLLYLPSLGFCLVVALGMERLAGSGCSSSIRRMKKRIISVLLLLLAASFTIKTWTRNADWANRKTLFESGLRSLPNNAKMHYNYANLQKDEGRLDVAIDHYRQAIKLWPNYASAMNNLGTVLLTRASDDDHNSVLVEAKKCFYDAIGSHPHHVHAHYNLAVLHWQAKETQRALDLLNRCLLLNPTHREALQLLHRLQQQEEPHQEEEEEEEEEQEEQQQQQQQQPEDSGKVDAPSASYWLRSNRIRQQRWNETARN